MDISPGKKNIFEHLLSGIGKRVHRANAEPAKILTLHRTFNPHANEYSYPQKKGFLKSRFTQAAAVGFLTHAGAKLLISTSVRALDITGSASAVTGGLVSVYSEMQKERKDLSLGWWDISKKILAEEKWKYTKKLGTGALAGFVGGGLADLALDYTDGFGSTIKEWTRPLRNWITGIGDTLKNFTTEISTQLNEKWTGFKNWLFPGPYIEKKVPSFVTDRTLPPLYSPMPDVTETIGVESSPDIIEQQLPTPVVELTTMQQFAGLLDTSDPKRRMDSTVYNALKGKLWAMNEAVDGLYNGRFGFPKNPELAAQLIQEYTASLEGVEKLSKGQEELLLKLAFMKYNPENIELGVDYDPEGARNIIQKLSRSWVGAPELMEQFADAAPTAKIPEEIFCTAQQNPPGIDPPFKISCAMPEGEVKGDTILNLAFDGAHGTHKLHLAPGTDPTEALSSMLSQLETPEAPELAAAR